MAHGSSLDAAQRSAGDRSPAAIRSSFHTDPALLPEKNVGLFMSFSSRGEHAVYAHASGCSTCSWTISRAPVDAVGDRQLRRTLERWQAITKARAASRPGISLFYLLQQDVVSAPTTTGRSVSSIDGKRFRGVAPGLWRA